MKIRTIIIDDEKLSRELIKKFLEADSDIEIIEECSNGFEGAKSINELKPDLIFLDIQMPKLTGFEMIELIEHYPQIIFSTAYDDYAIKAFEVNAIDYLLKPYSQERFNEALAKAKLRINENFTFQKQIESLNEQIPTNKIRRITVNKNNTIHFIDFESIYYLEALDDYVQLVTDSGKFLKKRTMKYFEDFLPADEFIRVHRSFIVRINQISKLEKLEKENHILILSDKSKIPVSKTGYSQLKLILNI